MHLVSLPVSGSHGDLGGSNPKCEIRNYRCAPWTPKKHMEKWRFESLKNCWWKKSPADMVNISFVPRVLYIPGGAGLLPWRAWVKSQVKIEGNVGHPIVSQILVTPQEKVPPHRRMMFFCFGGVSGTFLFQRRPSRMNFSLKWPSVWSLDRNIGSLEAWLQRQNQGKQWKFSWLKH